MNNIVKTRELGQSIWLDYIRRSFITSGDLGELVEQGLAGMTSNPTIFEKAITGSADYDDALRALAGKGLRAERIYDELTLEDISMAADLLRSVYEDTRGGDGYVSLEVNPALARDTEGTVREGLRLFRALNRPNVMIKVPATAEGIPAIERLIREGVNVNVTLIFSLGQYREAAGAYVAGLRQRAAGKDPLGHVASVASFFVSRVDTVVDEMLHVAGLDELAGKAAIANSKVAYSEFTRLFSGDEWEALAAAGARVQRPLWASTSTKNPAYADTLYVDSLIGPDTVNTLPMNTLHAFLDHGKPAATVTEGLDEAVRHLELLREKGIDLDAVTTDLLTRGVEAFAASFQGLLAGIRAKTTALASSQRPFSWSAGSMEKEVRGALERLRVDRVMARIWDHDHSVWKPEPSEITNRLGWLNSHENMKGVVPRINDMVRQLLKEGYTDALLLGMGGSSLAPDLFRKTFGTREGYLDLRVLDSTDPEAVSIQDERLDLARTLFIVSTKSGTTVETLSFFKHFYNRTVKALGRKEAGSRFVAITDPGSPLERTAAELGFRETFLNDPDIGGRYSALSYFGLVPAALLGVDIERLLERAATTAANCEPVNCPVEGDNTGAILGAFLGTLHNEGVDKMTFVTSPQINALGAWLEQLLAESTGKEGKGILPVDGEIAGPPEVYGSDRLFVYLRTADDHTHDFHLDALETAGFPAVRIVLADLYDLGGEFFRWEMATAVAGHILGINPFDQPDVESAKVQARNLLARYRQAGALPPSHASFSQEGIEVTTDLAAASIRDAMTGFLSLARAGDYVCIQAYIHPTPESALALGELRHRIRDRYKIATTLGFGPRFLHSTGQLHKGDAGRGLFIQVTSGDSADIPIPDEPGKDDTSLGFGVLKAAQALGDRQALLDAGRRVIRFHVTGSQVEGLRLLGEMAGG